MSNNTASSSSVDRPLALTRRRDLIKEPMTFRETCCWNVKDPVSLRYYQLSDEELFIQEQVDGVASLAEIQRRFERRFAPRKLELSQLHSFLGNLHRAGLIEARVAGQGEQLLEQHRRERHAARWQTLANVLAIRFRGIDPEPWLAWLYPKIRGLFSPAFLAFGLLLILSAVLLIGLRFETFLARLPEFQTFFGWQNILLLSVVLACCKILHELGHALTCKHFGGACHELGVMFLVFTPCLYCNVSDAWLLRSKWQRIAISAAGMCVELWLAACATFLWWFSQPGVFNSICLNVMFVCSISTLLFNGNPLLRYDGYFVLADLVEIPNLRQQAQSVWQQWLLRWCWNVRTESSWRQPLGVRWSLMLYGLLAGAYRWLIVASILGVLYYALLPYRLERLAQLLGSGVIAGMLVVPIASLLPTLRDAYRSQRANAWPMLAMICGSGVLVWLICLIPVSHYVRAPVVIEPSDAARVHVTAAGRLVDHVALGQRVESGDVLATLDNLEIDRQVTSLIGERDVQQLYVEQLARLQVLEGQSNRSAAGSQLVTAREALRGLERRLGERRRDQSRLRLTAPRGGVVLPAREKRDAIEPGTLPTWSGSPIDERNLGCYLEAPTTLCLVGEPTALQGIVLVEQGAIERVRIGQRVRILVDELHEQTLIGTVTDIARRELEIKPPELLAKRVITIDAPSESRVTSPTHYAVSVKLSPTPHRPPLWASGWAKIEVEPRTLGQVLYTQLCETFRIDL